MAARGGGEGGLASHAIKKEKKLFKYFAKYNTFPRMYIQPRK